MSKILSYKGLVKGEDGYFHCAKCGQKDKLKMIAHYDGAKCYGTTYNCMCGNVASISYQREECEWA